jgi:PAS domain S-box-containing protein
MSQFLKKVWAGLTHVQLLAAVLAFALMVIFSYHFMSDIERKHMIKDVNSAISNTQVHIEADLLEPETTLGVISENIREMVIHGSNLDEVSKYISNITNYITTDERLMSYATRVYGVFDVFGGIFMAGIDWTPPDGFIVEERPWYIRAVEANGKVAVTEPYDNIMMQKTCITFGRRIFFDDGRPIGVVCLDVFLDRIGEYAVNLYVSEGSYGILLDSDFNVLAHPHPAYLGKNLVLMNDGPNIKRDLLQGMEISERKATDYFGNQSVLFMRQLKNGWYLAIIAYAKNYYHSITNIGIILTMLGLVLAAALSAILLSLVAAKKRAENRTMMMLDAAPLGITLWDRNINLIDFNMEAARVVGIYDKQEYRKKFAETVPEYQVDGKKSAEKLVEVIGGAFEEGYVRVGWNHKTIDGEIIPFDAIAVRLNYNNDAIVVVYCRDLREFNSVVAKMREADECTQVLFDATPLSCFMIDNNMRLVECNQEIVRLFGLSDKHEFIEKGFDFFPEHQPTGELSKERFVKYIDEVFEEGYCRFEWMYRLESGEQIPTEVSLVRVKFKGKYAVAGYIRDLRELKTMIAEMRRAEMAEENSKAKSDFLAKMSHEIRTPMNAILGITEIQLQDNSLPLITKEALERIYNSGDLLLGIINDILDLSKIEAGKFELVSVQYDIASLIHDTVKLNIMRYESKPIMFKLNVDENMPSILLGDELRIKQILNNLLSNAFKYTQEGQIELTLSTEMQKDSSDVMLIFQISDTGQGMTMDQVHKLGDKFSRFNIEVNRKTEGTGLGMNITRNLIQLMNGEILVDSTPGMGSTFIVRLPQVCANPAPIGRELAENLMKLNLKNTVKMRNAQITQDFMPYGRVLIVDDVETNLYVARGLIAPYGISIDTALSGFEAVDKIREGATYDIIFMDHMMPKMDGIEAIKIIRSLGYTQPVVALTANALAGQAEMFLNNGFDDFISKPIDIRQLNAVLNKMIRDKQTPEILEEARRQKNSLYAAGGHHIAIDPQLAEFFVRDAEKAVSVLNDIYENSCGRDYDLPTFIINVHAMKSALANVGESELSNEASRLEQAGRDENINLILSSLPKFLVSLQKVIDKLKPSEEDDSEETVEGDSAGHSFLQEKLLTIQAACASYDKKAAKNALADLKQKTWPLPTRDHLSAIAEHLLHSEFDEAATIAREVYFL